MSRRYFIWLTLALLTFTAGLPRPSRNRLSAQARPVEPVYEVYAISYGIIDGFSVSGLVAGADKSRKIDIQMMVWLLKGQGGRNVLVDSGFYRDKFFKQWKIRVVTHFGRGTRILRVNHGPEARATLETESLPRFEIT